MGDEDVLDVTRTESERADAVQHSIGGIRVSRVDQNKSIAGRYQKREDRTKADIVNLFEDF